jgi:hypothetical protein
MLQLLGGLKRKVAVVNLDPANDALRYEAAVDVADLVSLENVQRELGLGPNGGLLYCLDYLGENLDWLEERLRPLVEQGFYFLFDCPGQTELFTSSPALKRVIAALSKNCGLRLACVHLVDSHLCTDPSKYISAVLVSLSAMLHLEMPHVNILSKVDMLEQYGGLGEHGLDFFTEAQDLRFLAEGGGGEESNAFDRRFQKLTLGLCDVVEDFGLVNFIPLDVESKESMLSAMALIDKAVGYHETS